MKGIDIFCSSPASTAICSSTKSQSTTERSRITTGEGGGGGGRNVTKRSYVPKCSSSLQYIFSPININQNDSTNINIGRSKSYSSRSMSSSYKCVDLRRKSCADKSDGYYGGSSRYLLLRDEPCSTNPNRLSVRRDDSTLASDQSTKAEHLFDSLANMNASVDSSSPSCKYQVVDLKVSIHCKGCEGKIRKHMKKMKEVRSIVIDLASKKMSVIGDVTPLQVLAFVSKVKSAQLWPSSSPPNQPSFFLDNVTNSY